MPSALGMLTSYQRGLPVLVPAHQQKGGPGGIEGIEHPIRSTLVLDPEFAHMAELRSLYAGAGGQLKKGNFMYAKHLI